MDFHAFKYRRWSINTKLFKGIDLNTADIGDNEQSISADLLREQGRRCGQALAVHLTCGPQQNDGADESLPVFKDLALVMGGPLLPDKLVNKTCQSQ